MDVYVIKLCFINILILLVTFLFHITFHHMGIPILDLTELQFLT